MKKIIAGIFLCTLIFVAKAQAAEVAGFKASTFSAVRVEVSSNVNTGTMIGKAKFFWTANGGLLTQYYTNGVATTTICTLDTTSTTWTVRTYGPNGSAGSPTYSFSGDPDTGIFSNGTNNMGFAANGVNQIQIGSGFLAVNGSLTGSQFQMLMSSGAVTAPSYSFNVAGGAASAGMFWNSALAFALPSGFDYSFVYNGSQIMRISPSTPDVTWTGTTKTADLGTSSFAWDDVWADDFQNVADIPFFDYVQDAKTKKAIPVDDIAAIRMIEPMKNAKGELIFNAQGHAYWNDDTAPQWIFTKDEKTGKLYRDPNDGKPFVSLKVLGALAMGGVKQLAEQVDVLKKENSELKERLDRLEKSIKN